MDEFGQLMKYISDPRTALIPSENYHSFFPKFEARAHARLFLFLRLPKPVPVLTRFLDLDTCPQICTLASIYITRSFL